MSFFDFLLGFRFGLSSQSRPSGVARQPVTFFIRFAHPTERPSGAQQTTLSTAKKSNQKMPQPYGEA
jgi:hypothetical protein